MFSDNGWPGISRDDTVTIQVPGTTLKLRVAPATAWIFTEFAKRFNETVEKLDGFQLDDWGYAWRNVRGSSTSLSCHASGTAVDFNALRHPRGVRGTYSAGQMKALRKLLDDFDGVIKWGGGFKFPSLPDEMHFQIRGSRLNLKVVQDRLTPQDEEEDDVSFKDKHKLTATDVAAYGGKAEVGDEKSYDELVRFPPGVERLRREIAARDTVILQQLSTLAAAVEELSKK